MPEKQRIPMLIAAMGHWTHNGLGFFRYFLAGEKGVLVTERVDFSRCFLRLWHYGSKSVGSQTVVFGGLAPP